MGLFLQIITFKEKDFVFDDRIEELEGDWNLVGFFQTEKYFSHVSDRIRKEFTFHEWIREDCDPIADQFDDPVVYIFVVVTISQNYDKSSQPVSQIL